MIRKCHDAWILGTPNTTYILRTAGTGQLEHLYYGPALRNAEAFDEGDIEAMSQTQAFPAGNLISYDGEHSELTLEDMTWEVSSRGKGDIRQPFLEIMHADGSRTSDFLFESASIAKRGPELTTLPSSVPSGRSKPDCLTIQMKDSYAGLTLELSYHVYEDCDVITRTAKLLNGGEKAVTVLRLMSLQLDLRRADLQMTSFHGAWAREMARFSVPVIGPRVVNSSAAGISSSRANPFVMLHPSGTTEDTGFAFACNLVYSGNHYEAAEVNAFGQTRFVTGINPEGFSWILRPGETFEAPEAVMTCTGSGFAGISRQMHEFVRRHITRGTWAGKTRPILLNSWEACYFKVTEAKMVRLAEAAKEAGIELFVMDDGWFLNRNDDQHALGDWTADRKKLPGGLEGLSEKIHGIGMKFGLWIEPEMVSVESKLYRAHPDWTIEIPGRAHSEGRTQRILDFANPDVVSYITKTITGVLRKGNVDYVKWDMNRIFSDVWSPYLAEKREGKNDTDGWASALRQGETAHRYILGFYRLAAALTEEFPNVLFEGCASGGNRFDLGMLCYFPQIWASDNTDAISRCFIQEGYSYGYPMSSVASHVSAVPNHQTLRVTPIETRFAVASFGVFGYELNLLDASPEQRKKIKELTALYKKWRDVLQKGDFYRGRMPGAANASAAFSGYPAGGVSGGLTESGSFEGLYPGSGGLHEWTCVSKDRRRAVGMIVQKLVTPNSPYESYFPKGLDPDLRYRFSNVERSYDIREFGDLINTQAPFHVKQDSLVHRAVARFVRMPGEKEEYTAFGSVLMQAGIRLKPAFAGTGYSGEVRHFRDFSARLYFMEAVEEPETEKE